MNYCWLTRIVGQIGILIHSSLRHRELIFRDVLISDNSRVRKNYFLITVWNFNQTLTNDVISFEQLGPGCDVTRKGLYWTEVTIPELARRPLLLSCTKLSYVSCWPVKRVSDWTGIPPTLYLTETVPWLKHRGLYWYATTYGLTWEQQKYRISRIWYMIKKNCQKY